MGALLLRRDLRYLCGVWVVARKMRSAVRRTRAFLGKLQQRRALNRLLLVEPWCVDDARLSGDLLEIRGWAIAPRDGRRTTFLINGGEFDAVESPTPRGDVGELFWYVPHAGQSGYVCRAKASPLENGVARVERVDAATRRPLAEGQSAWFRDPSTDQLPFPEAGRRVRVHGGTSESAFRLEGFTTFMKVRETLQRVVGRDLESFRAVLDWGCGCGRMTRYLAGLQSVTGIDIDADNVEWCRQHLPFGRFSAVPLHPPTALASSAFDLIIGISIFTHLKEPEQNEWLAELERIAAPGAILLVSVHGQAALCRANLGREMLAQWQRYGFVDVGDNHDLDGTGVAAGYYKNTLHSRAYLEAHWSKWFEILTVIPGTIGNFQDLVVLRKRTPQ